MGFELYTCQLGQKYLSTPLVTVKLTIDGNGIIELPLVCSWIEL